MNRKPLGDTVMPLDPVAGKREFLFDSPALAPFFRISPSARQRVGPG